MLMEYKTGKKGELAGYVLVEEIAGIEAMAKDETVIESDLEYTRIVLKSSGILFASENVESIKEKMKL
jgi:hypothetical protein